MFAILENGSVETMLRSAIDVECKPSSKHLAGEIKNKDDLLTTGPFVETLVAGPTMSEGSLHEPICRSQAEATAVERPT